MVDYKKIWFLEVCVLCLMVGLLNISDAEAANCWLYGSTAGGCNATNGCKWTNDTAFSGWCQELSCWNLFSQSECTSTNVPGRNCTWQAGGTSYGCERLSCMSFSGTNSTACSSNSQGLNCQWSDSCYPAGGMGPTTNCFQYYNRSSCLNATGCSWGSCNERGCWSYNVTNCAAAKDWNGKNCTWNSNNNYCEENGCWKYYNQSGCTNTGITKGLNCQWKYNSCQDIDCYSWDFTNATACINNTSNLSCTWTGSFCNKQDCWSYNTQSTCQAKPGCQWKSYISSGWCQEVQCWTWDSVSGGNQTQCDNNAYGLSCSWSGNPAGNTTNGWCFKNIQSMSCSNFTTERSCMDTYYCWWQYSNLNNASAGGTCNSPGSFGGGGGGTNTSILNEWNPGCYIFDMNSTDCNNVIGCNYSSGKCVSLDNARGGNITLNGLNCSYINSSGLCNSIPALSSCCAWQNGSCQTNKFLTSCRDQMQAPPVGASFCEDYNAYENQQLCEQIANSPWYMPCQWNNSTSKCGFKASDVFGNETQSLVKIDNKKNCEAAGGKWITESYCEGNISLPTGRCEYKFDEEDNCDKACFACENKDSSGTTVNATNAASACAGSKLGICEFTANVNASNGIGYCKAKEQFKKGVAGDCDSSCGDCTFKGNPSSNDTTKRPSYYCTTSKANTDGGGCKWITDNSTITGGYCVKKGEKTCEDACDRCKTQNDCANLGRTGVSNQTGSCKWEGSTTSGSCVSNTGQDTETCWDGIDNNNNNLIDCADTGCFSDSFCGFVGGDCFGWTNNNTCMAKDCEWVIDKWGSWCDFKGSQCWKYNQNSSSCTGIAIAINETLNIAGARLISNNINTSRAFALTNRGAGWVVDSVHITNASGFSIAGNYTVNYTTYTITFANNTYMVLLGGAGNFTNVSYQYYFSQAQKNCQWSNGIGNGWCEQDWSKQEVCMGLNLTNCMALNASGCNWTIDSWCSGSGNGTTWCASGGGWCDNVNFKPKNCWQYSSSPSCGNISGCSWRTDQYSMPHCEVNWSANCWSYTSNETCRENSNCIWDVPPQGGGWCTTKADRCYSYNQTTCNSALGGRCYWHTWSSGGTGGGVSGSCQAICWNASMNSQSSCSSNLGCAWKAENGWCEETAMATCSNTTNMGNETRCQATTGCRWKNPGWCEPKNGGFSVSATVGGGGVGSAMGGDCYRYDGNQTLCTNRSIINISCGWSSNPSPICEVDWSRNCGQYLSVAGGCNATNGCWFKNDTWSSYCTNMADQCWSNMTLQSDSIKCRANPYCINNSWGGCEPRCSSQNITICNASISCRWITGWCNPAGMNEMFNNMEAGAPAPLGVDSCPENGTRASVDLCGFGMKDMGDSYGFGAGVVDFSNASVCNKEKLSSFVMGMAETHFGGGGGGGMPSGGGMGTTFGTERTGSGNDTIIYIVYLDTDGSTSGGCALDFNSSAVGYEFRLKYTSQWNVNTSRAAETFNAYKCKDSSWQATDIKLSAWKKKMCSDIGGPMIAVKKDDLARFPTLYDSTKDLRVYVATIGNTGNISYPTDSAGPGWTTPGAIDFEIKSVFEYGADTAKFEDILKKGFVQGEDCFNSIDDDGDGNIDCNDWDCQYSSKCTASGVNAAGYTDTSAPLVTGVKIEEYIDAALIMYDTNKPTNGTLELYGYGDTTCLNKTNEIYDIGILSTNVRDYKTWHTALIYETNETMGGKNVSINWPLASGSTYNYKLKVCDARGKCAVSKCSSFKTAQTTQKCAYCNFVTRIKAPTGWSVAYDVNRDGTYEHTQGQVCGPNAGMKTNYTSGRKVNVKLYKDDGTTYFEFLNASLTKTALNDKVRTISTSGDIISGTNLVGLSSETRDKIINNLHPEVCVIKIPTSGSCTTLYHCDDSGNNCVDRTSSATLVSSSSCIWKVPYCEFSTYKTTISSSDTTTSSGGGGGGGGGGAVTNATKTNATTAGTAGTGAVVSEGESGKAGAPQLSPGAGKEFGREIIFYVAGGIIVLAVIVGLVTWGIKKQRTRSRGY